MSSNINAFIAETNHEIKKMQDRQVSDGKQIILGAYNEILSRSPFATSLFKHNHMITVDGTTSETKDVSDNIEKNKAQINKAKFNHGMTLSIQNNLAYSDALESGHSSQSPAGVYGVTEVLVQKELSKRVKI